jgi:beta-xylosidase
VLARNGRYVLFYTARDRASGFQCIARATSARPEGPYTDDSTQPFICQRSLCGSIDASPFVDKDGSAYVLWKSDENAAACGTPPRLWSQRLSDDGLSLQGEPVALLEKDQPWEGALIEGPSMVQHRGKHLLFYSANQYDSARYAVGYATCDGPQGPCKKVTRLSPFLASAGLMLGPGGQELFTDAAGELWMAFHAWTAPKTTYPHGARSLRLARLKLDGLGALRVQTVH